MEDEQFEAVIVKPDLHEEEIVHTVNGSNIGVMELGKRLLIAAKEGNTESVRNLMKGGAPFATDWLGTTSLHAAAAGGHLETCELLLRSGILKDARTKVEKTPLHMACQEGHCEVALLLLANGADVNAQDMLKMTPLHWAVEREQIGTIKVLLQNGADPAVVNKFDKTCYDIANDAERHDIVELLQAETPIRRVGLESEESKEEIARGNEWFMAPQTIPGTTARDPRKRPTQQKKNEARKGEYTVVGKKKSNFQLKATGRIMPTKTPPESVELVNGSRNKSADRPKTAIILPSYENKKPGVTIKKIKCPGDEEQRTRLATLQLLEEHGIEMLEGEDINLVASAVGSGQTVVLTEAGKQALSLTAEKVTKTKPLKRLNPEPSVIVTSINPISNSNKVPPSEASGPQKKYIKLDKSQQLDSSIEEINKKLEEAKREAEQYKELYAKKQREAEEYRNKLETITMSVCKANVEIKQEQEEEEEDEDIEEEEPEEDLDY